MTHEAHRKTKAVFATVLVGATLGAAVELERCNNTLCQSFMSSIPKSAEGAANVFSTTGAYGGGTAVMSVREISGYDDLVNAVSARPEQVDRYRELVSGWLRPLE